MRNVASGYQMLVIGSIRNMENKNTLFPYLVAVFIYKYAFLSSTGVIT